MCGNGDGDRARSAVPEEGYVDESGGLQVFSQMIPRVLTSRALRADGPTQSSIRLGKRDLDPGNHPRSPTPLLIPSEPYCRDRGRRRGPWWSNTWRDQALARQSRQSGRELLTAP